MAHQQQETVMRTIEESSWGGGTQGIVAVEADDEDDVIPGPIRRTSLGQRHSSVNGGSGHRSLGSHSIGSSGRSGPLTPNSKKKLLQKLPWHRKSNTENNTDELQISNTDHKWAGEGILANREDLEVSPELFAAGCNLLQAAARGDLLQMKQLLETNKTHVNFRDYDRRTALHVASSEGHLEIVQFLVEEQHARVNRSDRWGGSPLDDAHRHRHQDIVEYLRQHNAATGSGNRLTNLIKAAAEGDTSEVEILLKFFTQHNTNGDTFDINKGDYDKRTALALACGEGHVQIVKLLVNAGANVNVEDRWKRRPLDDAETGQYTDIVGFLKTKGATNGPGVVANKNSDSDLDLSSSRAYNNMRIEFHELEMIDRIGSGAFGEIYKCRWRGTLVAAKIIKSAKIRKTWVARKVQAAIDSGHDVDEAIAELDQADDEFGSEDKDVAIADFRREISVLKSLRHPHIVLLLAFSTTADHECLISELMKCSLLDVFKSHLLQGTRMPHVQQIVYATQLAQGMHYLHTSKPPIIHRDLKPANLLIDHSGVLKISDFGLSKIRPDKLKKNTDVFRMTGETGSYRFMAPEVFLHQDYNETVDIYSYAMIFFYLLVGRPPWPNLPGLDAVRLAAEDGDRPNLPRDLDQRLQALLKECWDENPSARPSFGNTIEVLGRYSADVFHHDSNTMVSTNFQENRCGCVIQ